MDTSSSGRREEWQGMGGEGGNEERCPICKGTGLVHPLLESGTPDYKRVVPCECTRTALQREKLSYLERYSNLGPLAYLTFETLSPSGRPGYEPAVDGEFAKHFAEIYEVAKSFAEQPEGWLVLMGPTGCGKTHLAAAIANYNLSRGRATFYISAADLLDHLRATFSPSSEVRYDELFEQVKRAPLLVLDDVGSQEVSPWANEKMEQLLNYRFNARMPTVITTDVPLEKLDQRLAGRVRDPEACRLCVVDRTSALRQVGGLQLKLLREMTFENFDCRRLELPDEARQNLEQAYGIAMDFAESPEGWLVLAGRNGCGKTHLAAAIANYQVTKGRPVFFVVVPDLLDHLRATFGGEARVHYDELFEEIKETPLLILDDFGEESATSWAKEKLYQLVNYRYNARLPMVVTTCLSLEELEPRIGSRMVDPKLSLVFNIMAADYRGDVQSERPRRREWQYR